MTLKDAMAFDRQAFFNADEFGDTVKINGEDVRCVIIKTDECEPTGGGLFSRGGPYANITFGKFLPNLPFSHIVVYAPTEDLPNGIAPGHKVFLEDEEYTVYEIVADDGGVTKLEVSLTSN